MKIIYQLIDVKTGERSPPLSGDRIGVAKQLRDGMAEHGHSVDEYGLLVISEHNEGDDMVISRAPFMLVSTFIRIILELEVSSV